jgi:tetratricopeptide (TPR) repeat protein
VLSAISDYRSRWNEQREQVCLATHRDGSQSQRLLDLRMACLDRRRSEVEGVLAMFAEADASLVSKSAVVLSGMSDSAVCTGSQSFVDAPPLPDDAGVRSAVLSAGNSLALGRAELLGARFDEVQLRLDEVPAVARSHSPVAADFSLLEARLQEELGAYSVAAQGFRKAYLLALEARDVDLAVQSAARAASLYGERLKLAEDSLWWRGLARAEMSRADVSMPLREIDVLMSEARLDLQAGRYRECRDRALEAKKIADRLGAAVPAYSALLIESMIGNAALGLGDYDSAHQTYVELLPRAEAALGAAHPRLSQLRSNHAQILQYLGQVDAGIDEAKRALQIAESNFGENHATTFAARLTLAIALDSAERDAEAVPAYLEALASGRAAMGDSHPDLVYVLNGLAQSLVELDRHQEALVYSGEAVAMLDRAEMPEDLRVETLVGHARAARRVAPQLWRSIVSDARSRLASVENTDAADQYRKQLDAIEIGE